MIITFQEKEHSSKFVVDTGIEADGIEEYDTPTTWLRSTVARIPGLAVRSFPFPIFLFKQCRDLPHKNCSSAEHMITPQVMAYRTAYVVRPDNG